MKRIKLLKEPSIRLSRWVVADKHLCKDGGMQSNYKYFMTRDEVRAYRKQAKKGHILQVARINYNFIEAWEV